MTRTEAKPRELYLDWISGLMILQMLYAHLLREVDFNEGFWFYSQQVLAFFMPWFFFKSGMFFREGQSLRPAFDAARRRLLVPFAVYSLAGYLLVAAYLTFFEPEATWWWYAVSFAKPILLTGSVNGNGSLWYLFSLFVIKMAYRPVCGGGRRAATLAVCALAPFAMISLGFSFPLLGHTLAGAFFFVCGHWMRRSQFDRRVFAAAAVVAAAVLLLCPSGCDIFYPLMEYGNWFAYLAYSLAAIIVINNLVARVPERLLRATGLHAVGRDSMVFLVVHVPLFWVCKMAFAAAGVADPAMRLAITTATLAVALPLLNRLLNRPSLRWTIGA